MSCKRISELARIIRVCSWSLRLLREERERNRMPRYTVPKWERNKINDSITRYQKQREEAKAEYERLIGSETPISKPSPAERSASQGNIPVSVGDPQSGEAGQGRYKEQGQERRATG